MNQIIIQDKIFRQYLNTKYYCSASGEIYSDFSQKILKPLVRNSKDNKTYYYIDINFGEGQKHIYIHRIVYETWIGPILPGEQINHKDDNTLNNHYSNLYVGSQQKNIQDCIKNEHRVGNCWILTVYDKEKQKTLTFCPAKDFIDYSGHPCSNGCLNRIFTRNWFKQRYNIISYYLCKNLELKQGVTTIPDECKEVRRILSPSEARNINIANIDEEIV